MKEEKNTKNMTVPSRIILVRHGVTEGNLKSLVYGSLDLPLTAEGTAEIRKNRADGLYPPVPYGIPVFTSTRRRTRETLEAAYGPLPHTELPELDEFNFGEFEGRRYTEVKEDPDFLAWRNLPNPAVSPIGGGDSPEGFHTRVLRGLENILSAHTAWCAAHPEEAATLAVLHGGSLSQIMMKLFPDAGLDQWNWIPDPGLGYVVSFAENESVSYGRIGGAPHEGAANLTEEELAELR